MAAAVPAVPAYIAAHAVEIAAIDRTPIGKVSASAVARKLRRHAEASASGIEQLSAGGEHRDYCGIGVIYEKGKQEYSIGYVHDGMFSEALKTFSSEGAFVEWLARQSDYSLCGASSDADHLPQERTEFGFNNQRLTRAKLEAYVSA